MCQPWSILQYKSNDRLTVTRQPTDVVSAFNEAKCKMKPSLSTIPVDSLFSSSMETNLKVN